MSKQSTDIFDLSEEDTVQPSTSRHAHDSSRPSTSKKIPRRHSDTPPSSSSSRKRKNHVNPVVSTKYSMHDLFGTDSEDEEPEKPVNIRGEYTMHSYFTVRYPKAFSRQVHRTKDGEYYVVLKIFNMDIIASNQSNKLPCPELVIKNRTDSKTEAWYNLVRFINASQRLIKHCAMFITFDNNETLTSEFSFQDGVHKGEASHHGAAKKLKKNLNNADDVRTTSFKRTSASDLFGSDSDEEQAITAKPGKKPAPPITSYFTKRIANGISRQSDPNKIGSHFIEVKVYNCNEIRNVQPMNRWRHAIITVKNQTNENTEAWGHLTQFIKATRNEFKDCRPDLISGFTTSYA